MFMYKLNLQNLRESNWIGSKITKKKYISSMQGFKKFKNSKITLFGELINIINKL